MQTLISVFEKPAAARRAVERLVQSGFKEADIHLQESAKAAPTPASSESREQDLELGERLMKSVEHEVAVDSGAVNAIAHIFSLLFGIDSRESGAYSAAVRRGQSVLVVDAAGDQQAETAAVILHECGAVDVDDHRPHEVPEGVRPGVRALARPEQQPLRELMGPQRSSS